MSSSDLMKESEMETFDLDCWIKERCHSYYSQVSIEPKRFFQFFRRLSRPGPSFEPSDAQEQVIKKCWWDMNHADVLYLCSISILLGGKPVSLAQIVCRFGRPSNDTEYDYYRPLPGWYLNFKVLRSYSSMSYGTYSIY